MDFKDIPIKFTSNEEETESTTISNLMKQWPYMDVTETEIETETEIPIFQPKWPDNICSKRQRQRRLKKKRCRQIRKTLTALCTKPRKVEEWNIHLPPQLRATSILSNSTSLYSFPNSDLAFCVPSFLSSMNITSTMSPSLDPTCSSPSISNSASKMNMTYQDGNILFLFLFLYALISFVRRIF